MNELLNAVELEYIHVRTAHSYTNSCIAKLPAFAVWSALYFLTKLYKRYARMCYNDKILYNRTDINIMSIIKGHTFSKRILKSPCS